MLVQPAPSSDNWPNSFHIFSLLFIIHTNVSRKRKQRWVTAGPAFDSYGMFSTRTTLLTSLLMALGRLCKQLGGELNETMDNKGACKLSQCYFSKWLWLSTARAGPGRPSLGAYSPPFISLPLIVCAFIFSLYRLWGVCVRSGSFKHCSKSIALIKGITSQKREKKKKTKKTTSCFEE